ncbi:cupin domain-containing protein [Candidatus Neomarinimicrobiota bacterium]
MQTHIKNNAIEIEEIKPGLRRQIMAHDTNLMLVKVYFDTGVQADKHEHVHQQITYVAKGKFEVDVNGQIKVLEAGDSFIIPSHQLHGATCVEEGILIDTFSPRRDDFLDQKASSGY